MVGEAFHQTSRVTAESPERSAPTALRWVEIATVGAAVLLLVSILGSWASWKPDITVDYGSALATGAAERVMIGVLLIVFAVVAIIYRATRVPRPRLFFIAGLLGLIAFIVRATYSYDGTYSMSATPLMYLAWAGALALIITGTTGFIIALRSAPKTVATTVTSPSLPPTKTDASNAAQPAIAATPSDDEKTCPDCAEAVKAAARLCRYCGFKFAQTAAGTDKT